MEREHHYAVTTEWTGNTGTGTQSYRSYERSHEIRVENKAGIQGSSDPAFRGDKTKHNPEDLLLASLSACHMLWFLHFCSEAEVIVTAYTDHAVGTMAETSNGSGHFTEVILRPQVVVTHASMIDTANALHTKAHQYCFIANSVNFPVRHEPVCTVA
ncbi:MAG: OsmC family peroxiredoxin [Chitinophagaceae bacterium]|nr:OsmC family protein [Bacteroidota bacterium]TAJ51981.1 MAG: OsmC family peroxiredoxin [Chitinophagaceae bacterium]